MQVSSRKKEEKWEKYVATQRERVFCTFLRAVPNTNTKMINRSNKNGKIVIRAKFSAVFISTEMASKQQQQQIFYVCVCNAV